MRAHEALLQTCGLSPRLHMELAGLRLADAVRQYHGATARAAVLIGGGQNGGDGYVALRHLIGLGHAAFGVVLGGPPQGAAAEARAALVALYPEALYSAEAGLARLGQATVLVDAVLGTGLGGPPRPELAKILQAIAALGLPSVAADVPSGVNAETGLAEGAVLPATETVAFGFAKLGHVLEPGQTLAGSLVIDNLGMGALHDETEPALWLSEGRDFVGALPPLPATAHKGMRGKAAVLAGSFGMLGAGRLATLGALAASPGYVHWLLRASDAPYVAPLEPSVLTAGLSLEPAVAVEAVLKRAGGFDAWAVGPGLGLDPWARAVVRALWQSCEGTLLLDADAITIVAEENLWALARPSRQRLILTPHPGEMARLTGQSARDADAQRATRAPQWAKQHGLYLVLKGRPTVVATPEGEAWINPSGSAALALAGSGDVLSGLLCGLLARGLDPALALRAGVYWHGVAGERLEAVSGSVGYASQDLPQALRDSAAGVFGEVSR